MNRRLRNDRGITLVVVIMVMVLLLSLTGAGLLSSGISLKTTASLKTGTNALHVADAGIQHALAVIPSGGAFNYTSSTEVVPTTTFPSAGYTYRVTAVNAAGGTQAILTSTALGPNSTQKVIIAYIGRGPGGESALSSPWSTAANTTATFAGNSFQITGNDTNPPSLNGTDPAPSCGSPGSPVPGIGVTDAALRDEITDSNLQNGGLDAAQMAYVTGAGGVPSVSVVSEYSVTLDDVVNAILAHPPIAEIQGGGTITNVSWGTDSAPQITRITGNAKTKLTGTGAGILIVDGALEVVGNFQFHGLVIVRGAIEIPNELVLQGTVDIYGSVLLGGGADYKIAGNSHLAFSRCALNMARNLAPDGLPQQAKLLAWQEKFN